MFEKTTSSVKNFVARHKTVITVTVTAAVTTALVIKTRENVIGELNEFLKENDLYDTYYTELENTY